MKATTCAIDTPVSPRIYVHACIVLHALVSSSKIHLLNFLFFLFIIQLLQGN